MLNAKEILCRLRTLRKEKSIRQEYVAKRLGIDRTTYVRKEQGAIPITTDEWLKLARAMGKEPSYFFSRSGASEKKHAEKKERLLIELYRSLSREERAELLGVLSAAGKGPRKKDIKEALEGLPTPKISRQ
ncbi:MAG: helix-turn-helix transcriptional regulator [Deltaproteobacteria bacterium]|nr:helix-turn-helix transcriptional regulator [Deltaproteobacteria bacterium]